MQRLNGPTAPVVCALLVGVFCLSTLREGHAWGDDFSMYIAHGRNLADGMRYAETGYIYNPHNPAIGPRAYPPGFPLLLAPVIKVFGLNLRPMKVLIVLFLAGTLLAIVWLFRPLLPSGHLTALVLLVGLNPWLWNFKDHILSDVPFLCFALLSLRVFILADTADRSQQRVFLGLATGAAAYAAYATRTVGIVLLPSFLAHDAFRHRRITATTLQACTAFTVLAFAQYLWIGDTSYGDQFTVTAAVVSGNTTGYLRSFSEFWENGYSDTVRKIVFLGCVALAALGYARVIAEKIGALELFPLFYALAIVVWPSFQGTRFLVPLVPLTFYYALSGIRELNALAVCHGVPNRVIFATFVGITALSYAGRYSMHHYGPIADGIEKPESVALFDFVKESTTRDDVFVFSRPRALALFTGRRTAAPFIPADPCRLWDYLEEIRASYVVTGPDDENAEALYLPRFVSQFSGNFQQVMSNNDVAVYRIVRRSCTGSLSRN
jgi:hypothetical protein